jgi:hypothetical protein
MNWRAGFPAETGMYFVQLNDNECIITPWNDGTDRDDGMPGWRCLSEWRGRVRRWCPLVELVAALDGSPRIVQ